MQASNDIGRLKAICRVLPLFALLFSLGCPSATQHTVTTASKQPLAPGLPSAALVDVERDAGGITFTQHMTVTDDVRSDYDAAVRMLEAAQYDGGIALLLKVTERAPASTAAHIDLGIAYERTGDLAHAEASLNAAMKLDPHNPAVYNELGLV